MLLIVCPFTLRHFLSVDVAASVDLVYYLTCYMLYRFSTLFLFSSTAKCNKEEERRKRIKYSDLSFGFAYMAIVVTVITIVLVYAFKGFPANTYYDRTAIISGV